MAHTASDQGRLYNAPSGRRVIGKTAKFKITIGNSVLTEAGAAEPNAATRFKQDWFEPEPPAPSERYEQRCQAFIEAYYPELLPRRWSSESDVLKEVWTSQMLSNQYHRDWFDIKHSEDADLWVYGESLRKSQKRRKKKTCRDWLREARPNMPKLYLKRRARAFRELNEYTDDYDY